jgi:hypothetical protein
MTDRMIEISAYVLWAVVLASVAYKFQTFPTPFGDSLSDTQKALVKDSSRKRMNFFVCAFIVSFAIIYICSMD